MKNRDWLLKTAAVDVLCMLNKGMKENWQWKPCIMSALGYDFFDRADRCRLYGEPDNKKCRDCIAAWLNEEKVIP